MRVESCGQSRPQDGRRQTENQDAFTIGREPVPYVALCDGAGNAQSVARRALGLLDASLKQATLGQLLQEDTWRRWGRTLDTALLGGPQTTLIAAAVLGDTVVGMAVGDSRAYLVPLEGHARLVTETAAKARLGSGEVEPTVFRLALSPRDVLLLLSDGAWGPLGFHGLDKIVRAALTKHFAELPQSVLDAAGPRGRADDMTAVALRLCCS